MAFKWFSSILRPRSHPDTCEPIELQSRNSSPVPFSGPQTSLHISALSLMRRGIANASTTTLYSLNSAVPRSSVDEGGTVHDHHSSRAPSTASISVRHGLARYLQVMMVVTGGWWRLLETAVHPLEILYQPRRLRRQRLRLLRRRRGGKTENSKAPRPGRQRTSFKTRR